MLNYAADHDGAFPLAGGRDTAWAATPNWLASDRDSAFGVSRVEGRGQASVSSCFYLLVKYGHAAPETFVCPGDDGTTRFRLSDFPNRVPTTFELADAWDFGPPGDARKHCSYAYQMPFSSYALTTSHDPRFPVAADRNPWIKSPAADPAIWVAFRPGMPPWNGSLEQARAGNAIAHGGKGQNVLFVDGHVEFAKRAYCGLDNDNIYTVSIGLEEGHPVGMPPYLYAGLCPANGRDAVLVHDPPVIPYGVLGTRTKPEAEVASKPEFTYVPLSLAPPRAVDGLVVIDDFERYTNDPNKRLFAAWIDGLGFTKPSPGHPGNGSSAYVGHDIWSPDSPHLNGAITETELVHGGTRSLPLYYNNDSAPWYSHAEATWEASRDLTGYGADALALYVHGREGNGAEPLYVAFEDDSKNVAIVNHADPNILTATEWIEWRMPLSAFSEAGVDLRRVRKLYIGVGNRNSPKPGGSGVLYIDDIQLIREEGVQGDLP
jgi:prepilin-type processing-associated H-X9-DG protein